jgi:hypothetical protein
VLFSTPFCIPRNALRVFGHCDIAVRRAALIPLPHQWRSLMSEREIVICNPVRTAIGTYGGSLKDTPVSWSASVLAGVSKTGLPSRPKWPPGSSDAMPTIVASRGVSRARTLIESLAGIMFRN